MVLGSIWVSLINVQTMGNLTQHNNIIMVKATNQTKVTIQKFAWVIDFHYFNACFSSRAGLLNVTLSITKKKNMYHVSIKLQKHEWEFGRTRNAVSTAFQNSPKLSYQGKCFYNSIETWRTCFLFLLENTATTKMETTC